MSKGLWDRLFYRDMYGRLWVRDDAVWVALLAVAACVAVVAWVEGHTPAVAA